VTELTKRFGLMIVSLLVLASCGGGGGAKTEAGPPSARPSAHGSNPSPSRPGGGSGTATKATPSTSAGGSGGTQHSPSGKPGGRGHQKLHAGSPQPLAPRKPGTYRYDTTGESTYSGGLNQDMPPVTTLTVDEADGLRQRSVRDLRESDGDGSVTETVLLFRADGVYLESVKSTTIVAGFGNTSEFRPEHPALVAKTGAAPGDHVEFTMSGDGSTAHVTIDVVREERVKVGDQEIDTFLVRTETLFSGDVEGESSSDTWYAPDRLLPV
jgi:hypothetical protein